MTLRRRIGQPRLFWRLYLAGLGLLALVFVANVVVGTFLSRSSPTRLSDRLVRYAAERVAEHRDDPTRMEAELRQMAEAFRVDMAVRLDSGEEVARAGDAPVLPAADLARLDAGGRRIEEEDRPVWAARVAGSPPAHVVIAAPPRAFPVERAAVFISAWLVALGLAAFPLARALARPMERLTEAARKLGAGDLSARAGLRRSDEVGELSAAFDDMAGRLEGLVRAERQLLADVSHELRTPLARIRVALDLAAEGDLVRARRYLEEIRTDLDELDRLVEDVLTAAKLDQSAGGADVPLRLEQAKVEEVVARAAERFRRAHPGRRLDVAVQGPLPGVIADPALLRRALENLLDNAAKYSEATSGIRLEAHVRDGDVEVAVVDQGIGVDPEDLPRLFTPFFRTDRSRARGSGGVGLGLALAKRIVEGHGGSIAVESQPGVGTTVRFRVPVER